METAGSYPVTTPAGRAPGRPRESSRNILLILFAPKLCSQSSAPELNSHSVTQKV